MMDSTVNTGMCRCCASEGAFKDIKSSYHWMGEEEIYSDMLRECFDIILNVSEHGDDGGICEVCITQLRNAINFKKQVLHTEDQFQKHLQNKTLFRPNIVKVEVQGEDDSDDNMGSGDEGFSGTEFEVPIKTEADDPKPKKRAAKASATTTRASAKKAKADAGETSTKRARGRPIKDRNTNKGGKPKQKKGKKVSSKITKAGLETTDEMKKHHTNLKEILTCSNATPFVAVNYRRYMCGYCDAQYPNPADLKKHTRDNHKCLYNCVIPTVHKNVLDKFLIRLDITDLQCTLCETDIDTLENLIKHLESNHKRDIHTEIKNQLFPFKFNSETLKCCLCSSNFDMFKSLQEHMHIHYRHFICDECGMGYITKESLRKHIERHGTGVFKCNVCSKTFLTKRRALTHERGVHVYKNFKSRCGYCDERFKNEMRRDEHLVDIHGVKLKVKKCQACDRTFSSTNALRIHTRRDHLMERRFKCTECDKAFFQSADVKFHMVTHTKTREFQCTVCLKLFSRKTTLIQHMEIHSDIRRFKCERCGQAFVQKASWKGHMRSKHGELV